MSLFWPTFAYFSGFFKTFSRVQRKHIWRNIFSKTERKRILNSIRKRILNTNRKRISNTDWKRILDTDGKRILNTNRKRIWNTHRKPAVSSKPNLDSLSILNTCAKWSKLKKSWFICGCILYTVTVLSLVTSKLLIKHLEANKNRFYKTLCARRFSFLTCRKLKRLGALWVTVDQ